MKLTLILLAAVSAGITFVNSYYDILFVFIFTAFFALFGVVWGMTKKADPLNDVPNALRVFLSLLGGNFLLRGGTFLSPSAGLLLVVFSVVLNDEFQRLTIDSMRKGKRGGSVAFLGIDGSGKSTHATATSEWVKSRGYRSKVVPFHRYLFVEKLVRSMAGRTSSAKRRRNPLRPLFSLVDNMALFLLNSFAREIEGTVVIYDRFIWSTYVKYLALGYPVKPLTALYLFPRPRSAIVFDIPVKRSMSVIDEREIHIKYPRDVLAIERDAYNSIAKRRGYPILDSTRDFESVQMKVEASLAKLFPRLEREAR